MELLNLQSASLSESSEVRIVMLNQTVEYGNDPEASIKLDMLENDIYEAVHKTSIDM